MVRKINYSKRAGDLVSIFNSRKVVAKKLGVSQSTLSRILNGKGKVSKVNRRKINSRWRYQNKTYLHQPRLKVKLSNYDHPVWISGDLVPTLDELEDATERIIDDFKKKYEEVELIKLRVRRFTEDGRYRD